VSATDQEKKRKKKKTPASILVLGPGCRPASGLGRKAHLLSWFVRPAVPSLTGRRSISGGEKEKEKATTSTSGCVWRGVYSYQKSRLCILNPFVSARPAPVKGGKEKEKRWPRPSSAPFGGSADDVPRPSVPVGGRRKGKKRGAGYAPLVPRTGKVPSPALTIPDCARKREKEKEKPVPKSRRPFLSIDPRPQ